MDELLSLHGPRRQDAGVGLRQPRPTVADGRAGRESRESRESRRDRPLRFERVEMRFEARLGVCLGAARGLDVVGESRSSSFSTALA